VFVVWEPIQPTDWYPPTTFVMGRIPDGRVQQYWDPDHLVAKQLSTDARSPQPEPECCVQSGVLWDLAAVYPKGALWEARMPTAHVFNGPVIDITSSIESALTASAK
jgi:hypothetical protein